MDDKKINIIKEIISYKTGIKVENLKPEMSIEGDLELDNFDITEISIAIEMRFDIFIDDGDAIKLETLGEYIDLVSRQIDKS